jgi:hypothetical protein
LLRSASIAWSSCRFSSCSVENWLPAASPAVCGVDVLLEHLQRVRRQAELLRGLREVGDRAELDEVLVRGRAALRRTLDALARRPPLNAMKAGSS